MRICKDQPLYLINIMRSKNYKSTYLVVLFCILSVNIKCQVTIGSGIAPASDALLDLKEFADGKSTKGLLLPRVNLLSYVSPSPLSRHVEGMMVYNNTSDKGICVNDGIKWKNLDLPKGFTSGQFLVLDQELKPTWTIVSIPLAQENRYSLIESKSIQINNGLTFLSDNTSWLQLGDIFSVVPNHVKNRIAITIQTIAMKEYKSNNNSGWISYSGAIFANGVAKDSRIGRLVYESHNSAEVFQIETLHFVLENLPLSEQKMKVAYKRRNSMNSGGQALYIGTRGTNNSLNNFVTKSIISYQYYEDRTSPSQ